MKLVVAYQRFTYSSLTPWVLNSTETPPQVRSGSAAWGRGAACVQHCRMPRVGFACHGTCLVMRLTVVVLCPRSDRYYFVHGVNVSGTVMARAV